MDVPDSAVIVKVCRYVIIMMMCYTGCRTAPRPVCESVTLSNCAGIVNTTRLPNVFGHFNQNDIDSKISQLGTMCQSFSRFLCILHLPPCHTSHPTVLTLPCRQVCEGAKGECPTLDNGEKWPYELQCHNFPTENCLLFNDSGFPMLVETSLHASGARRPISREPPALAPLETELGDNEEYSLEVVSMSSNQIPQRRYDVIELGDDELYQGWADVQGSGAANDYCRVLGRGKRRFLSCALAGTTGQGHQYVSKLGFDVGHKNTWFMRDVDNDGRDDYCRCVGKPSSSRISCMKAGEKAFYGNTIQGGSQYSFDLPGSSGCHNKRLNPQFGA